MTFHLLVHHLMKCCAALQYRAKILRQRAARDHSLLDRMELHKEAEALLRK